MSDPFTDDALLRLAASNQDYYRTHGHYVPPLAQRLLDTRAENARLRGLLTDTAIGLRATNASREQIAGAIERALDIGRTGETR